MNLYSNSKLNISLATDVWNFWMSFVYAFSKCSFTLFIAKKIKLVAEKFISCLSATNQFFKIHTDVKLNKSSNSVWWEDGMEVSYRVLSSQTPPGCAGDLLLHLLAAILSSERDFRSAFDRLWQNTSRPPAISIILNIQILYNKINSIKKLHFCRNFIRYEILFNKLKLQ